jgi:hypothetical protein
MHLTQLVRINWEQAIKRLFVGRVERLLPQIESIMLQTKRSSFQLPGPNFTEATHAEKNSQRYDNLYQG